LLPDPDFALPTVLDTRVVTGTGGGPDKTILNSPRFLRSAGYRMLCAYMHSPEDRGFEELRHKAQAWRAPLLSVPDRGAWDWQVVPQLVQICRRERVQIWHGHDYKSNALGLLVRLFWPMHLVTTVHGWVKETRRTPLYYAIDRRCLHYYKTVICVSDDLHQRCLALGIPARRCVLIENGIDLEQYSRKLSVGEAKRRLGLPPERLVIGAVGRLSAEKGFAHLIRSSAELRRAGFDFSLLIVGQGEEEQSLRNLISESGCADRITLLGYRSDLIELYQAMDIFALSSLREGLPNVLLEAMALEVPVMATAVAGVPRLIRDGENGLLVRPGSAAALTPALARLLAEGALRRSFAQAAREIVEKRYSFAARMQRIRKIYDRLLGRRGTHAASSHAS
jgi:glycosyltransferase involved in cell wall biosynthesis